VPLILSVNNPGATSIAPGSIATANGQNLASTTASAPLPLPTSLSGTSVSIVDALGNTTPATILSVSPNQIEFIVPAKAAFGTAQVIVTNGSITQTSNNIEIASTAPGVFSLNGSSLAAAYVVEVNGAGTQTVQQISSTSGGASVPVPIALSGTYNTYLVLYGTGIANGGTALTAVTINGVSATVSYAGPEGTYAGLDQVNVLIPPSLAGKGNVNVQLTAEGVAANPVQITIQ
jgi:uncharacterized protein (TIGR03437 family)